MLGEYLRSVQGVSMPAQRIFLTYFVEVPLCFLHVVEKLVIWTWIFSNAAVVGFVKGFYLS